MTSKDQGTTGMMSLAASFSKKVSITNEPVSFSFSFDLSDDDEEDEESKRKSALKKKNRNKNKKMKKKANKIMKKNNNNNPSNDNTDSAITEPQSVPEPSLHTPASYSSDNDCSNNKNITTNTPILLHATATTCTAAGSGSGSRSLKASHSGSPKKKDKEKEKDSPSGLHVISSRDPELSEEQRKLRRFGKGLNVSIIGPPRKKKVVVDWTQIPPGFGFGLGGIVHANGYVLHASSILAI